jgi:hypothetical protein
MTASVAFVVPFRTDEPHRVRAWRWVERWWRTQCPDYAIVTGEGGDGPWNKPKAVNEAVAKTEAEILILADPDVFARPEVLEAAVRVAEGGGWATPRRILKLNPKPTARVLAGQPGEFPTVAEADGIYSPHHGLITGPPYGVTGPLCVLPRTAFERCGGYDERFSGWGGYEHALGLALKALIGPFVALKASCVHLWHPSSYLAWSGDKQRLMYRYWLAADDWGDMQRVIGLTPDIPRTEAEQFERDSAILRRAAPSTFARLDPRSMRAVVTAFRRSLGVAE